MSDQRSFRRTTWYCFWLAGFLAGLGLARLRWGAGIELVLLAAVLLAVGIKLPNFMIFGLLACGVGMGAWRGGSYLQNVDQLGRFASKEVVVQGVAASDGVYGDKSQLEFDLGNLHVIEPDSQRLVGKMIVRGFGENMVYKGDEVVVSGKLYLTRGSRQSGISFADIKVTQRSTSALETLRRKFEAGMLSALPEPLGSFGLGLLIGQRSNLPKDLSNQLSIVGLTHIVAVSGYNLTIIMRAVKKLLVKRSKYQATLISLLLMAAFVLLTGFSASIVRAALVSGLSLWAWYYGRSVKPVLLILLVAALTAGINPLYIWSDIGWYLSFLAFFGVLVLGPELTRLVSRGKEPKLLASVSIETFSAQIMTVPIVMYIFSRFSLVALLSNILVAPLVSVAMALGLVAGLAGMIAPALAGWLSWPARLVLTYMIDLVQIMAGFSWASFELPLSLFWMMVAYAASPLLIIALARRNRGRYGTIKLNSS